MTDESVFRSIAILSLALTLPIGLYHRIRSQATREKLARRQEGIFIMIGLIISMSLLTANWLLALLGLSAFAMMVVRTRIEEEKLIERFGDEYQAYMERTGRFFPHVRH